MKTIRLGINARLFPFNWRPARDEIGFVERAGFTSIQFRGQEQGADKAYFGDELERVGELLRGAGIEAVMEVLVILNATTGRSRAGLTPLEILHNNLPAIRALGCSCVHWHLAAAAPFQPEELPELEHMLLPLLAEGVALGQQHGFYFGLEHNETGQQLFASPETIMLALDQTPGLGFVWDLNHSPSEHVASYLELVPRMSMLHLADSMLPELNQHLPIGQGNIDFGYILGELHRRGFRGPGILEIGGLPRSGGYGKDTDEALRDSLARLRGL